MIWLAVALGGAIGSLARHAVSVGVARMHGPVVPMAVAITNVAGCLLIGMLAGAAVSERWNPTPITRAFLFIGVLGGFTTFSAFGGETFHLLRSGAWTTAALSVSLQFALGVGAVAAGFVLARGT